MSPSTEFMSSCAVTMIQATLALGGQAFRDRLQVGHQLGVVGDVLADFIDEEVEPEIGRLLVEPGLDLVAEVLD